MVEKSRKGSFNWDDRRPFWDDFPPIWDDSHPLWDDSTPFWDALGPLLPRVSSLASCRFCRCRFRSLQNPATPATKFRVFCAEAVVFKGDTSVISIIACVA